MKNKQTLTIAAIVIALAILATFGIFRNTESVHAQDTTLSLTHLNVPERNVVNLVGTSTSNLREVNRDGSVSLEYTVPAGMVLVITDIAANVHSDENVLIPLSLRIFQSGSSSHTIYRLPSRTDKFGYVTTKDHFSGGLMVGPGNKLQLQGNSFLDITASVLGYTVPLSEGPQ